MTKEPTASGKPEISEERQWELARASLRRADESTNYLRTLMFVAAGGLIFCILPEMRAPVPRAALLTHLAAAALSALAVCIIFYGWHIQRLKARERFNYLREGNYEAYLQYDKAVETISSKRDSKIDALAFIVLLAAFAAEIGARCQAIGAAGSAPVIPGVHV